MEIHGWKLYFHECFRDQLEALLLKVTASAKRYPDAFRTKNSFKVLAAIIKLAFNDIPQNPADPKYRQGLTLGDGYTGWFRAKFFQQYRLFFRFSEKEKVIIFAWVNDEGSLRAYGEKTDAYVVFRGLLEKGIPPADWAALKKTVIEQTELVNLVGQVRRFFPESEN
jgi:toxin YhaV